MLISVLFKSCNAFFYNSKHLSLQFNCLFKYYVYIGLLIDYVVRYCKKLLGVLIRLLFVLFTQGDLAKKKIYPTLWWVKSYNSHTHWLAELLWSCLPWRIWPLDKVFHIAPLDWLCLLFRWLFRDGLLPEDIYIVGFSRSDLSVEKIKAACLPHMKVIRHPRVTVMVPCKSIQTPWIFFTFSSHYNKPGSYVTDQHKLVLWGCSKSYFKETPENGGMQVYSTPIQLLSVTQK